MTTTTTITPRVWDRLTGHWHHIYSVHPGGGIWMTDVDGGRPEDRPWLRWVPEEHIAARLRADVNRPDDVAGGR